MTSDYTMTDIRNSVGFHTVCQGLCDVFGETWSIQDLRHGDTGNDFRMKVWLAAYAINIYIDLDGTDYRGVRSSGTIGVAVPTTRPRRGISIDGEWIQEIVRLVGTEEDRARFHFGSSGNRLDHTIDYFNILKRYLDSGAPDSH